MAKINELVAQLGPGWALVGGGTPVEELNTIPNPAASNPTAPANTPSTIQAGTGRYMVIVQDPEGHQRAMFLTAAPIKGGLTVPISGQTPPPNTAIYTGDLRTIDWNPSGPVADVPAGAKADKPATPSGQLDRIDANGRVIPPDDTSTKAAKLRDPNTGTTIDLPDAKEGAAGTLKEFGDQLLLVKPDGSYSVITSKTPDVKDQAKSVFQGPDGAQYEYDPAKPAGQRTTRLVEGKPTPTAAGNIIWQDIEDQPGKQQGGVVVDGKFVPTQGLTKDKDKKPVAVYGTSPNDKYRITVDDQGNVVSKELNENYKEAPGTQLTADTVAENIQILKPDGTIASVPNTNRVTAGAAMADLMQQVGLKVNAGEVSMDDAKNMLTSAVNLMTARTAQQTQQTAQATVAGNAAQNILSTQAQGAQAAAGMLQNRATTAQNLVQQGLNVATSSGGKYGNYSGGMLNPVAGLGQDLVQGAAGYATELGGGQAVFDTAVRMVQAADPNNQNPDRAQAVGVLTQIMDRYKQSTGQDYPTVAATKAAAASTAGNGMAAPVTAAPVSVVAPVAPIAAPVVAPWQRADQQFGAAPAGNVLAPAGVAGTVSPDSPMYLGTRPRTAAQLGFVAPETIGVA